jgi:flavorubredoxin
MFPSVADILTYLKGLRPKGLIGAVFGSFGWSGEGNEEIAKTFEEMRVEIVDSPVGVNYSPDNLELQDCYKLGVKAASRLQELWGKER